MRELQTARLTHKLPLSGSGRPDAFHLSFEVDAHDGLEFQFQAGQFVSCVADDPATGKTQTRAYSLASAPAGRRFDLCLNRVEGGFFSNLLCDLKVGDTVQIHGPHGYFTLQPAPSHALLIATGTGIAPIRGFLQELFPAVSTAAEPADRERQVWLVHGPDLSGAHLCGPGLSGQDVAGGESDATLYYRNIFEALAARHTNFRYMATSGDVQEVASAFLPDLGRGAGGAVLSGEESVLPVYAYVCGMRAMVTPMRKLLQEHGWEKRQILSERYD